MTKGPGDNSSTKKDEINPWSISGLGMELVGAIVGMGLLGWFVDHNANTAPWGVTIGALIGLVGGGYNFGKRAMALQRRSIASMDASRFRKVDDNAEDAEGDDVAGSSGSDAGGPLRESGSLESRKRPSMMDRMFGSEEGEMEDEEDVRWPSDFDGTPTLPNQPPEKGEER